MSLHIYICKLQLCSKLQLYIYVYKIGRFTPNYWVLTSRESVWQCKKYLHFTLYTFVLSHLITEHYFLNKNDIKIPYSLASDHIHLKQNSHLGHWTMQLATNILWGAHQLDLEKRDLLVELCPPKSMLSDPDSGFLWMWPCLEIRFRWLMLRKVR